MSYTVKSSERLRKSGADFETKSLLYLMNFHSSDIEPHYFIVDFFNDLTGMDRLGDNLIDVQSKAKSNACAKEIGRELVTLYKNYLSDFHFTEYILFLGGVPASFREDDTKTEFYLENVKKEAKESLISGLKEEINTKEYTKKLPFNQEKFDEFIDKVLFVINDKTEKEYIKGIIKTEKINKVLDENKLIAIFNEIRDRQASKKNTNNIEGITIQVPFDALNYGRHLTADEIRLFIVNRLLLGNPFESGTPSTFLTEVLKNMPPERIHEESDNCRFSIARVLFNKNSSDNFWKLFENIYITIKQLTKSSSLNDIYKKLDENLIQNCPFLDILSTKYLISAIRDGIYDN